MGNQRRNATETINDIIEAQLAKLAQRSDASVLSLEEVQVFKLLADVWNGSKGRNHRGKDNFGASSKVPLDQLTKYAKG